MGKQGRTRRSVARPPQPRNAVGARNRESRSHKPVTPPASFAFSLIGQSATRRTAQRPSDSKHTEYSLPKTCHRTLSVGERFQSVGTADPLQLGAKQPIRPHLGRNVEQHSKVSRRFEAEPYQRIPGLRRK